MIPELKGFALVFGTTHKLLHKVLEGLAPEQATESRDGANPILWVAAHTVVVRASFSKGFGAPVDVAWGKGFARGAEVKDVTTWPTLDEVRAKWDEVHAAFTAKVEGITAEQAAASTPIPGLDGTLLGAVGLAALHDAYHIGQLSAARRRCGLDRIVG
jgi:hypothetical protein